MTDPVIAISYEDPKWKKAFPRLATQVKTAATTAFGKSKLPSFAARMTFEISIVLTNDQAIKRLNSDYRNKQKPTNVLSFPQLDMKKAKKSDIPPMPAGTAFPLGDVVLALGVIRKEAKEQGKTVESHTLHMIVHGVLHLLGYDHIKTRDARIMEKLESDIMQELGYPDPYSIPYLRLVKD